MNYFNHRKTEGSANVIKALCAVLFCGFTFVYLYFYQADMLAVAQHILSGGVTTYNRLIGAIIITVVLMLVQVGVSSAVRLGPKSYALTYFPSALALALLASMAPDDSGAIALGLPWWLAVLLLAVWGGLCFMLRNVAAGNQKSETGFLLQADTLWKNVMLLSAIFLFVGFAGNNDSVMHYRMKVEGLLLRNDFAGAAAVGQNSHETDAGLTQLRVYALSRQGVLPDVLFKYAIEGSSSDIVPMANSTRCLLYPNDSIYRYLGARPARPMSTWAYLYALRRAGYDSVAVRDYVLCGYLIDRNLDGFTKELPKYYDINDSLPLHYREALTLYTHLRAKPVIVYHNDVMDTDYEDLQELEKKFATREERKNAVRPQYSGTYWWYYEYGK